MSGMVEWRENFGGAWLNFFIIILKSCSVFFIVFSSGESWCHIKAALYMGAHSKVSDLWSVIPRLLPVVVEWVT